ncbi:hypothetical protein G6F37_003129 [Rhizopus arrhizus]|nr:hypothetical protein G6F37_003129 [Rhizopus arrhizus]
MSSSIDKQDNEAKNREEDANQFQFQNPIIFSNYREIQVPPFLGENHPKIENEVTIPKQDASFCRGTLSELIGILGHLYLVRHYVGKVKRIM